MIKYCTKCVTPATRPGLTINAQTGVCSACENFDKRKDIDWKQRREEFMNLVKENKQGGRYDCVIGVSGGKDSTWQTIKCLEYGLTPLCVVASTCMLTDIGQRNINNLNRIGVDLIEYKTNPKARHKLNRFGLVELGDISFPEHIAISHIPIQVALNFGIPIVVYGEDPDNEYGGFQNDIGNPPALAFYKENLQKAVEKSILTQKELIPYTYPSVESIEKAGLKSLYLGYFFEWDAYRNLLIAQANGFETYPNVIEGGMVNYENLDNAMTAVHDYFMMLKFGFGRATTEACLQIRRSRITRAEGIKIVRKLDGRFPWSYLGYKLTDVLEKIDMGLQEFKETCDKWTNKELFVLDETGYPKKDRHGNLTKVNYDNED